MQIDVGIGNRCNELVAGPSDQRRREQGATRSRQHLRSDRQCLQHAGAGENRSKPIVRTWRPSPCQEMRTDVQAPQNIQPPDLFTKQAGFSGQALRHRAVRLRLAGIVGNCLLDRFETSGKLLHPRCRLERLQPAGDSICPQLCDGSIVGFRDLAPGVTPCRYPKRNRQQGDRHQAPGLVDALDIFA